MANICINTITILNDDFEALSQFDAKIEEWSKGNKCLGEILKKADIEAEGINLKTDFVSHECNDGSLTIHTESAWNPSVQAWLLLAEKHLKGFSEDNLFFRSSECGFGIYLTNDPDFIGKYIIDSENGYIADNYCGDDSEEESVVCILQKILDTKEADINKLLIMNEERDYDDDDYVWIHQWEEASLEDVE